MEDPSDDPFQDPAPLPPYDPSEVVELRCIRCLEVTVIGDDPKDRADWVADAVEREGWAETPDGLICPDCNSPDEDDP